MNVKYYDTSNKRSLMSDDITLVMHPSVAKIVGRTQAIVLQQIHYWLASDKNYGVTHEGMRFIRNTYDQWNDQLAVFSKVTIRRAIKKLENMGIVLSIRPNDRGGDQTRAYAIDYTQLKDLLIDSDRRINHHENSSVHEENVENTPQSSATSETPDLEPNHVIKMITSTDQNDHILTKITSKNNNHTSDTPKENLTSEGKGRGEELIFDNLPSKDFIAVEQLLKVWNETVEEGREALVLTKQRARYLRSAFKLEFQSDLCRWTAFCKSITTSDFLMGKVKSTFRATLDWVLRFNNMKKIFEGLYGIKKAVETWINPTQITKTTLESLSSASVPLEEKNLRKEICERVGGPAYTSWFEDVEIVVAVNECNIKTVHLRAPNAFKANYIQTHFSHVLEGVCEC